MSKQSLKERALELQIREGIPCMEGKEKGELSTLEDMELTITDFGFITEPKKKEEYAVFTVKEFDDKFYFGGLVITDHLRQLQEEGYYEEIQKDGLPIYIGKKIKSKNGLKYTPMIMFPDKDMIKELKEKK